MMNPLNRDTQPLSVSVCIPAYNEEKTIFMCLKCITTSIIKHFRLKDVVVVSDSTDRTNEIVERFIKLDSRIKLISNSRRLGLSRAISIAVKNTKSDVIVVIDADVFLKPCSIDALIRPFYNNINVYATTGRKIPISECSIVHAFWNIHHELCLIHPKLCSSIMAFRRELVCEIPQYFGTPDTFLMMLLEKRGLRVAYVASAEGKTLEPNSLRSFMAQRKRIYIQHLFLKKISGYNPPAFRFSLYAKALAKAILKDKGRILDYLACTLIEFFARLLGLFAFRKEWEKSYLWEKVR